MKLKCDKHNRRVLTTSRGFEHRTGDLSVCDGNSAIIGTTVIASADSHALQNRYPRTNAEPA
jgi:hypothetical protein